MHIFVESARKAAKISGMTKNYPDDRRQRGAGYWAAFLGSLNTNLAKADEEYRSALKKINDLEHQVNALQNRNAANAVQAIGLENDWSEDQRSQAVSRIAG